MIKKSALKRLRKLDAELLIDKAILRKLDREGSLLGKEKMLCEQALAVKDHKGAATHVEYYVLRVVHQNAQLAEFIDKELKQNQQALRNRIAKAFKSGAHKELYDNIYKVANYHHKNAGKSLRSYKKSSDKDHLHKAVYHNAAAEHLFGELTAKDIKRLLREVAIRKLAQVYQKLLESCKAISVSGHAASAALKKGRVTRPVEKDMKGMHEAIEAQMRELKMFATNYSQSIVRTIEYARGMKLID